jgi:V8-like Glu-specific endopeptidase
MVERARSIAGRLIATLAVAATGTLLAGTPAHAITGGSAAADGTYRFVAKIDVGGTQSCTGALIDPRWVITSAACFAQPGKLVVAGPPAEATTVTVGRTNVSGTAGRVVAAVQLIPRADRDLVLVRLATGVYDVPTVKIGAGAPVLGETLRVAGYGRTATEWVPDRLQTGQMVVVGSTDTTVGIAGQAPENVDICKGDAGGPAFREGATGAELVAIHSASWQRGCLAVTGTRQGAVETRLDNLGDWVQQSITVPISLFAKVNSRYVVAESTGAKPLIANRLAIGPWERFDQVDAGGGYIALLSHANGKYVTAENAGAQPLIANRVAIGPWEKFKIIANVDGTVSLLAGVNGKYVTAEAAGAQPLIANRDAIGPWEKFTIS